MARADELPNRILWLPQYTSRSPANLPSPFICALKKFCRLFGDASIEQDFACPVIINESDSLDLEIFFDHLSKRADPIYIIGMFSDKGAINYSWDQCGLNLFDLPWSHSTKAFRYIPLLSLSSHVGDLLNLFGNQNNRQIVDERSRALARTQLQSAYCHRLSRQLQQIVGHGNRDLMQTDLSWEEMKKRLPRFDNEAIEHFPCGDICCLKQEIDRIGNDHNSHEGEELLKRIRQVTALECRSYRMFMAKFPIPKELTDRPLFDLAVVLEDNEKFREYLVDKLQSLKINRGERSVKIFDQVVCADSEKSLFYYRLCDENGMDIIKTFKEKMNAARILACFDLDLARSKTSAPQRRKFLQEIFGGHWIMYNSACVYPEVPRLVITGFRSQDVFGHAAGSMAYLMKPITEQALIDQIGKARTLHRVKWLCPQSVQDDYEKLIVGLNFAQVEKSLKVWLDDRLIEVEVVEDIKKIQGTGTDLVILDLFKMHSGKGVWDSEISELLKNIACLRGMSSRTSLLLVIPANMEAEESVSELYGKMPLRLRDGYDAVIKKPMWIVTPEGWNRPDDGLGNMVLSQLAFLDTYDVKYQVLVPVAAILGRCDGNFVRNFKQRTSESPGKLYAPLLPFLINAYGLSGRLEDIARLGVGLHDRLKKEIAKNRNEEPDRLVSIDDDDIDKLVATFVKKGIRAKSIRDHLNLESWLRSRIDHEASEAFEESINSLMEPLARVFGGSTRYEFNVRGSWYEKTSTNPINDILIVVEFCAKSSIAARKFIEKTVVSYLHQIAGEKCVLVQEIPLRAFFW